jgi:hypothetical protein
MNYSCVELDSDLNNSEFEVKKETQFQISRMAHQNIG